ncbi:MAG: hypothetical protein ACI89L_001048 [Phycisphaerales bacterium]|jgi:hypothetical protein
MNQHHSFDGRLCRLERSAARWRGLALALIGAGVVAALSGVGGESGEGSMAPGKSAIAVEKGGFAVVEDTAGSWFVIHEAGSSVFKRVIPGQ